MTTRLPPQLPIVVETTFNVPAGGEAGPGANSGALGTSAGPSNLSDLINKYRAPMWVDEIRIGATNYSDFFSVFTQTSTRILFGRYPMTREFVPSSVLAPRWPGDGQIVIRLHKPLYITPQALPLPTIRSNVSLQIRFSLVGRLAVNLPQDAKIWVPYVTAFQGATTTAGTVSTQQSNRVDLANPFLTPFTARFFLGYRTVDTHAGSLTPIGQGLANNAPPMTVRVTNHLGRPVVRDPTPFFDLFNVRDQAWAINSVVERGGYFVANVDVDATNSFDDQQFNMSMFGYREENIQWGT